MNIDIDVGGQKLILGNRTYRGYNQLSGAQKALRDWQERMEGFRYP